MEQTQCVIELKGLGKRFGKQQVLQNINARFYAGKIIGIVGFNGSGKTVLLKCICGLLPVDEGSVSLMGRFVRNSEPPKGLFGILIENPGFLPSFTGLANLSMLAAYRGRIGRKEILDVLDRVELSEASKKPVRQYSLGMRQRLGVAQAIMENPDIYLLDEPLNGLDKQGVKIVYALLRQLRSEGKTVLLASHHQQDIDSLCDEVYGMEEGRLTPQ